jgi:hypothetical protein
MKSKEINKGGCPLKKWFIFLVVAAGIVIWQLGESKAPAFAQGVTEVRQKGKTVATGKAEFTVPRGGEAKTVVAPVPLMGNEEQELLKALGKARQSGDRVRASQLQGSLDELHGLSSQPYPASAAAMLEDRVVTAGELSAAEALSNLAGDVLVTNRDRGIKPSLAQAPNGDLFVAVERLDGIWIDIYRSQDGGRTWSFGIGVSSGDSFNPSITCTQDYVYVTFEGVSSVDGSRAVKVHRLNFALSEGASFTVASNIYMPSTEHIYPEICTDYLKYPDDPYIYVTYETYGKVSYGVFFSISTDQGATWIAPVSVKGGSESSSWNPRPDIAFGTAGLFITFEKPGWTGSTWENAVWVTKSINYGSSWSTPVKIHSDSLPCYHPRVAAAIGNQSVLVAYTEDYGTDLDISSSASTDGGSTWDQHSLPYTKGDEKEVELTVSLNQGRFHAAFWRGSDIHYTWTETLKPSSWANTVIVNDTNSANTIYSRPAICVEPNKPVDREACFAWTDFRNYVYDVYFDAVYRKYGYVPLFLLLGD